MDGWMGHAGRRRKWRLFSKSSLPYGVQPSVWLDHAGGAHHLQHAGGIPILVFDAIRGGNPTQQPKRVMDFPAAPVMLKRPPRPECVLVIGFCRLGSTGPQTVDLATPASQAASWEKSGVQAGRAVSLLSCTSRTFSVQRNTILCACISPPQLALAQHDKIK